MSAFIFVYEPMYFRNDSAYPVKQFELVPELRLPFASAAVAIEPGTGQELAPGIYGIVSDDSGTIEVAANEPDKAGVAFDLVTLRGKDPWPRVASAAQVQRVQSTFQLLDEEIDQFLGARDSSELAESPGIRSA